MMIEPAIGYAIKDNKLILDDLNDHQDYVEIDMKDVLFIQINQTNNTFHIAFLLNNDEQQYYTLSSLDDVADIKLYPSNDVAYKAICSVQNQKIKWTLLKSLFELLEQKKASNNSCFHYIKNKHNIMHYINMKHLDKLKLDIDLL